MVETRTARTRRWTRSAIASIVLTATATVGMGAAPANAQNYEYGIENTRIKVIPHERGGISALRSISITSSNGTSTCLNVTDQDMGKTKSVFIAAGDVTVISFSVPYCADGYGLASAHESSEDVTAGPAPQDHPGPSDVRDAVCQGVRRLATGTGDLDRKSVV